MSEQERFNQLVSEVEERLQFLPDKPEESAIGTVQALWWLAAGAPRSIELSAKDELPALGDQAAEVLRELVEQRLSGVPLAHLTQRQRFMGIEMLVGPGALIPRKETEILGQAALRIITEQAQSSGRVRVVDVCTGVGNLAIAIAAAVPEAGVYACDLEPDAIDRARENAGFCNLEDRIDFRVGDLLDPIDEPEFHRTVDFLCCNPPYISTARVATMAEEISGHEPTAAFDGGPFGIAILSRLTKSAPTFLRAGGWLGFEVGLGQGPGMVRKLARSGDYERIEPVVDHEDNVRAILAQAKH